MKSGKKLIAVLIGFALIATLAGYIGLNASAGEPGSPPIPGPRQSHEEFEPVECDSLDHHQSNGCVCYVICNDFVCWMECYCP
jgi:hypothetical protein